MTTLGAMLNRIIESQLGRIRWQRNMWALIGSQWDRAPVRIPHGELERGNMVLVRRLCTSRCPAAPGCDFATTTSGYWVPATECRKCQWHRPSTRGRRFPICTYRAEKPDVIEAGIANMIGDAIDRAKEMVKP